MSLKLIKHLRVFSCATNISRCCAFAPLKPTHIKCDIPTHSLHTNVAKCASQRELERIKNEQIATQKSDDIFADKELTEKEKNFEAYNDIIKEYIKQQGVYRRGHVEFINKAASKMKEYGVHRDIDAYKALILVFPQDVMRTKRMWEVESMHYPKQQQCCIELLDDMERNGVCPDDEFGQLLDAVFGPYVHVFRKYRRMMYWMPKLKHINPYPMPHPLPNDAAEQAVVALKRMAIDLDNRVSVHRGQCTSVDDISLPNDVAELAVVALKRMAIDLDNRVFVHRTNEETGKEIFIASAQSPKQQELVANHPISQPLYVEGPFNVWTRDIIHTYFMLSADPRQLPPLPDKDPDYLDTDSWTSIFDDEEHTREVIKAPSIHELPDRTVLGMCITETSTKDSLMSWIQILQQTNPNLSNSLVVFKLKSPQPNQDTNTDDATRTEDANG